MTQNQQNTYSEIIEKKTKKLRNVFAHAAVGDFSGRVEIPDEEDEFSELYAGANIMLDVINRQINELEAHVAREEKLNKIKSEFVAFVSHQLRTPLTIIQWTLEKIHTDKSVLPETPAGKDMQKIETATNQMVSLINTILNVSRMELGTFFVHTTNTDIPSLINESVRQAKQFATEKDIHLTTHITPKKYTARIDTELLKIILENLISNAIKYTPRGGKVHVNFKHAGSEIIIEVADNGHGIPDEDKPFIFSKLFRGGTAIASDPSGIGLGLYMTQFVITETGGTISFTSKKKAGTTFIVSFPDEGMHQRIKN